MSKTDGLFIDGLPIENGGKVIVTVITLLMLIINAVILPMMTNFSYQGQMIITYILIGLTFIFSIGNKISESLVIGVALFVVVSATYDLLVGDITDFRKMLLIGSLGVALLNSLIGEVSLLKILKKQFGL